VSRLVGEVWDTGILCMLQTMAAFALGSWIFGCKFGAASR